MQRLLSKLSEIRNKDIASRRLQNANFRNDLGVSLEAPRDTVAAIKEHQDKNEILRGLVYILPLSLPLLRLMPADEISADRVKEGFRVVCDAMEDTLADYSDLLNLPDSEQQDVLITQARGVEKKLKLLQDEHIRKKKELLVEQTLLEKKLKQITGFKKQIISLEEKLTKERLSMKKACEEEQRLRSRMKTTGSELEGKRAQVEKQSAVLRSIRQELAKVDNNKKFKSLLKKMDVLLAEVAVMRPDDELSTLAASAKK